MADEIAPSPALLFVSMLAGRRVWLDQAQDLLTNGFGDVLHQAGDWPFDRTRYYTRQMGEGLQRRMVAFRSLVAPDALAEVKRKTNALEAKLIETLDAPVERPVNLDPGILTEYNVVLATMKPRGHRVCLSGGVFAEATLRRAQDGYEPFPYTYPSYARAEPLAFFEHARDAYRRLLGREVKS